MAILAEALVLLFIFGFVAYVLWKIIPNKAVKQIYPDELKELLDQGEALFIDVRPKSEFNEFHIRGFKNIPLRAIKDAALEIEDKSQLIVLTSRTGTAGNEAAKRLKRRGFTNLMNVQGGMSTWGPE